MDKKLILIFFAFALLHISQSKFDQNRLRIVKENHNHRVVGGSSPVNEKGQYQYQQMISTFERKYNLKQPRLVSISLLNYFGANQTKSKYVEYNFFNSFYTRPNQAITQKDGARTANFFHWFSVRGYWISPSILPSFIRKPLKKYYKYLILDPLQQIFSIIDQQLSYNINSVVYVHSMEGLERTAYVLGAYRLKNNATLAEVINQNLQLLNRANIDSLSFNFQYGLQWYCLALGRSEEQCLASPKRQNNDEKQGKEL